MVDLAFAADPGASVNEDQAGERSFALGRQRQVEFEGCPVDVAVLGPGDFFDAFRHRRVFVEQRDIAVSDGHHDLSARTVPFRHGRGLGHCRDRVAGRGGRRCGRFGLGRGFGRRRGGCRTGRLGGWRLPGRASREQRDRNRDGKHKQETVFHGSHGETSSGRSTLRNGSWKLAARIPRNAREFPREFAHRRRRAIVLNAPRTKGLRETGRL